MQDAAGLRYRIGVAWHRPKIVVDERLESRRDFVPAQTAAPAAPDAAIMAAREMAKGAASLEVQTLEDPSTRWTPVSCS